MDSNALTGTRIASSPAVAILQRQLDELISQTDAAAVLQLKQHSLGVGRRYAHLERIRIGRRTFYRISQVLELLEARSSRTATRTPLTR